MAKSADTVIGANEVFHLSVAASVLRGGGIVAHATEAVWGLACDPFDAEAVSRLIDLKGRRTAKGLIVIAATDAEFAIELSMLAELDASRVRRSWPGPETWLVPNGRFPSWITGAHATVAVRVPAHQQARRLCERFGGPLVSTSANPAGRPPARVSLAVRRYFGRGIDYLLSGEVGAMTSPSRIRDAVSGARLR